MPERHYPRFELKKWLPTIHPADLVSMPERHYPRFEPRFGIAQYHGDGKSAFQCQNGIILVTNWTGTTARPVSPTFQCQNCIILGSNWTGTTARPGSATFQCQNGIILGSNTGTESGGILVLNRFNARTALSS